MAVWIGHGLTGKMKFTPRDRGKPLWFPELGISHHLSLYKNFFKTVSSTASASSFNVVPRSLRGPGILFTMYLSSFSSAVWVGRLVLWPSLSLPFTACIWILCPDFHIAFSQTATRSFRMISLVLYMSSMPAFFFYGAILSAVYIRKLPRG